MGVFFGLNLLNYYSWAQWGLLSTVMHELSGSYRTTHILSFLPCVSTMKCPVAAFFSPANQQCLTRNVSYEDDNSTQVTRPQGPEHSVLLALCASCVLLYIHVYLKFLNIKCFTEVREFRNPQQQLPKAWLLIAPATSRPIQFIWNWQNKRNTKQKSSTAGSCGSYVSARS